MQSQHWFELKEEWLKLYFSTKDRIIQENIPREHRKGEIIIPLYLFLVVSYIEF